MIFPPTGVQSGDSKKAVGVSEQPKGKEEIGRSRDTAKVRRISADGLRWVVREVPAPAFDRRGGTHLFFDGESVMRRVRLFPANWFDLSDEELYELSRRITPTKTDD